jgi:hypothetical protein
MNVSPQRLEPIAKLEVPGSDSDPKHYFVLPGKSDRSDGVRETQPQTSETVSGPVGPWS